MKRELKKVIKPEATLFNDAYAELEDSVKSIRDQLKQNMQLAKKIAKNAQKLYDYGNEKCYIDDDDDVRPIPGIKKLGDKMDLLDQLTNIDEALKNLIEEFDIGVK